MGQRRPPHWLEPRLKILFIAFSLVFGRTVWAQIRYSISEEQKDGAVVGNIAKDLGIDYRTLNDRRCRIVSTSGESLFSVNQNDGVLYVNGKIDREAVCERINPCLINLKIALENPLEIHYVTVDIIDVNDHAPRFPEQEMHLEIYESVFPGARFQLKGARDPDSGSNSVQVYKLSHADFFRIEIIDRDEDGKVPVLILQKPLDREVTKSLQLQLTALDGGKPPKSGTIDITIDVLDINDNAPVFTKDTYSVVLNENTPVGTTILRVNATDSDEGQNGEVIYALGHNVNNKLRKLFDVNPTTGDIIVTSLLDFEIKDKYQIDIKASDKGIVPLSTDKIITIKIADVNDNPPQIEVTSFSESVPEDSKPGTTVALISLSDLDSEINGRVSCSIPEDVPFKLMSSTQDNTYSLVTTSALDRETKSHYEVMLVAKDAGQPPLSSVKTITVQVSDVNDNSPEFSSSPYVFYVMENNVPGKSLFSVSASDKDASESGVVNYQIWRDGGVENKYTSFININSDNGEIYALKSFDFETVKTFQFHVLATDSGSPSLSSNVTVNVFILDQNDNVPVILYPVSANGSAEGVEEIPRNVNAGHLVTKVRAYDADIGYNGWLLFSLQEVSDHSLFGLDRYTGQIRTLRSFTETDEAQHKLVILVKDNGNVSLSATATVIVKVVEPKEAFAASDVTNAVKDEEENNVTFYLIITLGSVSVLFIISIIVLIVMQCSKSSDYSSKYLQDANYDGTLCHSIQYRSGDKRYMLVGPRMSVGSTLAPGSNRNTLVIPDCRRRDSGEVRDCKVW
nr:protocadherin gamma-A11-like [Misgurnus anguillicaudatus]